MVVQWRPGLAERLANCTEFYSGAIAAMLKRHPPARNPHLLFDLSTKLDCLPMHLVIIVEEGEHEQADGD